MKTILLTLSLFLLAFSSQGQSQWDIIELKDGKVYRGTIVEQTAGSSVRIQTEDGELLLFAMNDVRKITEEKKNKISVGKTSGYYSVVEFGYLYRLIQGEDIIADTNKTMLQLTTTQGLHLGSKFTAGLGIGVAFRGEENYFPTFLDLRTYFGSGKVKPYLSTAGGFAFVFNNDNTPGNALAEIGFGIKTYFTESLALNTSIGFNQQFYISKNNDTRDLNEGFFTLKLGISL